MTYLETEPTSETAVEQPISTESLVLRDELFTVHDVVRGKYIDDDFRGRASLADENANARDELVGDKVVSASEDVRDNEGAYLGRTTVFFIPQQNGLKLFRVEESNDGTVLRKTTVEVPNGDSEYSTFSDSRQSSQERTAGWTGSAADLQPSADEMTREAVGILRQGLKDDSISVTDTLSIRA